MKTVAIIQARMNSTRLPGKVLKDLAGKPVLWHLVNRLGTSKYLKETVVATTVNTEDDAVVEFCEKNKIRFFRGSEEDVLDRYYNAAESCDADPIVRITADCPVIDPIIVDEVVERFIDGAYDVYGLGGDFPDGLDCTVFAFWVLEDAWKHAELPSEREHVGPFMLKHPEKYKTGSYRKFEDLAHYRWTLDEEADYRFLQNIFNNLYKEGEIFFAQDIIDLLTKEPGLLEINSDFVRNEGYIKSLSRDDIYLRQEK